MPDRQAFTAILYVLRTGVQWNALPRELGADSTVHDRLQEWARAGFFQRLWEAGLLAYDDLVGLDWEWQAADGAMTKAPFGGGAVGPNPTDRAKGGTKRSLLTEGTGIPLAVVVDGANRHDMKLLAATLDGIVVARPEPTAAAPQHLSLDAGYDYDATREQVAARGYVAHIRPRGEERALKEHVPGWRARRWVVERTHSWLNRSRRLLVRWEKRPELYLAFVHLACAQLIFSQLARHRRAAAGMAHAATNAALLQVA
jgi:putative transposase